jgi:hypothetical protein
MFVRTFLGGGDESILFPIKSLGRNVVHGGYFRLIRYLRNIIEVHLSRTFGQCSHKHVTYPTETPNSIGGNPCHLITKRT